jgi:hypothetical protein
VSRKIIDKTGGSPKTLIYPCEAMIPKGAKNIIVNVVDMKGNYGTIEVGTDGFCQAVLVIDGKFYKFYDKKSIMREEKVG